MSNEELIAYLHEIFGGFFDSLLVLLIICILIAIELIVANMLGLRKIFIKAKKPSWASFVPIYREWILCEMVGISPYWVIVVLFGIFLFPQIPYVGTILSIITFVYYKVITSKALAKSFNCNNSYVVGIAFLPAIFYMIIGYNDKEYQGARVREEAISKRVKEFLIKHKFIKEK